MEPSLIFLLIAIIVVGILVFIIVNMTQRKGYAFNKEHYQSRWLEIENLLNSSDARNYNHAVMEADKLLDHAMVEIGFRGRTMGERLKHSNGRFTNLNGVWSAHKIRNQIAHEIDYQVSYNQAKRALNGFRDGLKDLGAI